jgi:tetratricopeptide (TPR) repeat protein
MKLFSSAFLFMLILTLLLGCGGDKSDTKIDPAMCNFDSLEVYVNRLLTFSEDSTIAGQIAECVQKEAKSPEQSYWVALGLGKYSQARNFIAEPPADENPAKANNFGHIGLTFYLEKKYDSALIYYDSALNVYKDDYRLWFEQAMTLMELTRQEEAVASFDSALVLKHDDYESWYNRANVLYEMTRAFESLDSYDSAIAYNTNFGKAYHNRGILRYMLGDHPDAVASFDTALMIDHTDYMSWSSRGLSLGVTKHYEEAIASFDSSIKYKHDYSEAWKNRAAIQGYNGNYEDAKFSIDSALFYAPHDPGVIALRELVLENLKKAKK